MPAHPSIHSGPALGGHHPAGAPAARAGVTIETEGTFMAISEDFGAVAPGYRPASYPDGGATGDSQTGPSFGGSIGVTPSHAESTSGQSVNEVDSASGQLRPLLLQQQIAATTSELLGCFPTFSERPCVPAKHPQRGQVRGFASRGSVPPRQDFREIAGSNLSRRG
jgi:hypothetical protein